MRGLSPLVLASASPRRKELLSSLGVAFTVEPSRFEERAEGLGAKETAGFFAEGKARETLSRFPNSLVLGADTVVSLDGRALGKPVSKEDAAQTLRALSGRTHSVFTGVCLAGADFFSSCIVCTLVTFARLKEELIEKYVESGLPMDKAGAYGIQDGYGLVERYEGSYSNVVGLPLDEVRALLAAAERRFS